eukprot:7034807-Prymnesium_polylepis.1
MSTGCESTPASLAFGWCGLLLCVCWCVPRADLGDSSCVLAMCSQGHTAVVVPQAAGANGTTRVSSPTAVAVAMGTGHTWHRLQLASRESTRPQCDLNTKARSVWLPDACLLGLAGREWPRLQPESRSRFSIVRGQDRRPQWSRA